MIGVVDELPPLSPAIVHVKVQFNRFQPAQPTPNPLSPKVDGDVGWDSAAILAIGTGGPTGLP
jgi:hypothetical protein